MSDINNKNQTAFSSLTGAVTIKQGIANIHHLLLTSSALITQGKGEMNLPKQTINLQLEILPQQTLKTHWQIPILVVGELQRPSIYLNTQALAKLIAEQELDKIKTNVNDQIPDSIRIKAGTFLQNLLGA
jgi:uncharacterized protein YhdP